MGLDQYLYRVSKIDDGLAKRIEGKNRRDLQEYFILDSEGVESDETQRMLKDLLPYLTKVKMLRTGIDIERAKKDNNVEMDYDWIGYHYSGDKRAGLWFIGNVGAEELVECDVEQYEYEEPFEAYVCQKEEVYYWRKAYEVQDYVYDALKPTQVENCGYYLLSPDIINDMVERGFIDYCFDDSGDILYHEWY